MNLRSKFLLIIVGFLLLQGAIFYAYFSWVALPGIDHLEAVQAEKNAQRITNIFKRELEQVQQLTEIWAKQRPFAYFVQTNQAQKIDLFYTKERLLEENVHAFYVIDKKFTPLKELAIDPITKSHMTMIHFIDKLTQVAAPYFNADSNKQALSGMFMSSRGPMLVSIKPILTQQQDKLGWIIMGRLINAQMLAQLNSTMRTDMSVFPLGVSELPDNMKHYISVIKANPDNIHIESSQTHLKTYTYLSDLSGQPSIILLNVSSKEASFLFHKYMKQGYAFLLAVNFILVLVLLKILHHAFVKPTQKISDFILEVTAHIDSPPRIRATNKDELGLLKQRLNDMIVTFCNHRNKSINKAYRSGVDSIRQEMIEEITVITDQVIPKINNLETRLWSLSLNSLQQLSAEVQCSKPGDLDWHYLEDTLDKNNDYLSHELNDHRKAIRTIKQNCLRIASILKGYSINMRHSKPFTTSYQVFKRSGEQ